MLLLIFTDILINIYGYFYTDIISGKSYSGPNDSMRKKASHIMTNPSGFRTLMEVSTVRSHCVVDHHIFVHHIFVHHIVVHRIVVHYIIVHRTFLRNICIILCYDIPFH